ncbi:MAG: tetratricopeptide repeat protein [Acidobacteria bacterium]|nr:tetratricopeptide repeat protein [Acidobacteriota bacterium]
MKRSERHHLKENAFAVALARFQDRAESWGTGLAIAGGVALAAVVLFGGYTWWSERAEATAGVLLAEALVVADAPVVPPPVDAAAGEADAAEPPFTQPPGSYPTIEAKMSASLPKLLETADAYPSTPSGITARYRAAAALAALGRHDEAAEHYRQVVDSDEGGVYGRMATLGLASVEMSRGAYDEAIALLEPSSVSASEASLPVDGVLMQLGQAYRLAGRADDARAAFQRIMDEFPTSLYFPNAERELQVLQIEG